MKKKIVIAVAIVLVVVSVFTVTVFANESGLLDNIKSAMKSDIDTTTDSKIEKANEYIQSSIEKQLTDVRTYQTNRANTEIGKYLDEKLNNIATSGAVNTAANEISAYTNQIITEEKARVDQAIADFLGQ
jgi:ethanolamine transporter EutH